MLIHVRPDGTRAEIPAQHLVFKITLPNKESHALDFTAAQYGWYGPAMIPWAIFEEQRLDTVLDTRGFGAMTKDFLAEARESKSTENHFAKVLEILKKRFKDGLAEWQQQNLSFQALLKCSEEDFAKKQSLLFTFMDRWMSKEIIKINKVTRVSASAG